jgi:hypothetical protein
VRLALTLFLVACAFAPVGAMAGPLIRLNARLEIPTADVIRQAAVGDFDEDGIPDIVVVHRSGVEIFRGLGSARYDSASIATISGYDQKVVATDLNHDGHLDLAMTGVIGAALAILLGDGAGHFTGPAYYGTLPGDLGGGLAVADLNGDGHPDIARTNDATNLVSIFPGDGEGLFTAAPTLIAFQGSFPYGAGIVARDFNGDGKTDLVIGVGGVYFIPGDGAGGFGTPVFSGWPSLSLASADFDGDGVQDLATLGSGYLTLLHGTGDGHFTPTSMLPGYRLVEGLATGDLNGDGRPDFVVAGHFLPMYVFLATGPMQFAPSVDYLDGYGNPLVIADLDQDGRLDLLGTDDWIHLRILRGNGFGRFAKESRLPAFPSHIPDLGAADFDGDGLPDLAVLQSDGPSVTTCNNPQPAPIDCGPGMQVQVVPGLGQALFGPPISSPARCAPTALAIADFNGDGRPDIATANRGARNPGICYAASLSVLAGDGQGHLATYADLPVPDQPDDIVAADFDDNGTPDVAVAFANAGMVGVYRLAPGPALVPAGTWVAPSSPLFLAAGDLNGDGHLDLAVALASGEVAILHGDGSGLVLAAEQCPAGPGGGTGEVAIGDFDADSLPDIAAIGTKSVRVMHADAGGSFCHAPPDEIVIPDGARRLGTSDLNHDGFDDLLVTDGTTHISIVAGASSLPPVATDSYGVWLAGALTTADFDADGLPDIAVANPSSSGVGVARNISAATPRLMLRWAGPPPEDGYERPPVPGDAGSTLFWTGVLDATGYDVVRGRLATLRTGGGDFGVAVDACVAHDLPWTVVSEPGVPDAGDGWWYLARPLFPAGHGSYDGEGPGQVGSRDPEIAASPLACP